MGRRRTDRRHIATTPVRVNLGKLVLRPATAWPAYRSIARAARHHLRRRRHAHLLLNRLAFTLWTFHLLRSGKDQRLKRRRTIPAGVFIERHDSDLYPFG